MSRCLKICVLLCFSALLMGQRPVGQPTALNGTSPRLEVPPLWLGNADYGYRITKAPAFASGLLVVSLERQVTSVLGISVGVSLQPQHVLAMTPFTADASGTAWIARPIGGPQQTQLLGQMLYAQAAVADGASGILGATETVQIEIKLRPAVYLSGNGMPSQIRDPYSGQTTPLVPDHGGIVAGSTFINGGANLIVAAANGLWQSDLLSASPGFSLLASGAFTQVEWDAVRKRIFAFTQPNLLIFDGDRSGATFGVLLQSIPLAEGFSLSADGSRILTRMGLSLVLLDSDPSSPTVGQTLQSLPISSLTGFNFASSWHLHDDGRSAYYFQFGNVIPIIQMDHADLVSGSWVDHNPALPGIQALGINSAFPLPQLGQRLLSNGGRTLFTPDGSGGYYQVDFDAGNLSSVTVTGARFGVPTGGSFPVFPAYLGFTSSGQFLVKLSGSANGTSGATIQISLVHVATGTEGTWFTYSTPNQTNIGLHTKWR